MIPAGGLSSCRDPHSSVVFGEYYSVCSEARPLWFPASLFNTPPNVHDAPTSLMKLIAVKAQRCSRRNAVCSSPPPHSSIFSHFTIMTTPTQRSVTRSRKPFWAIKRWTQTGRSVYSEPASASILSASLTLHICLFPSAPSHDSGYCHCSASPCAHYSFLYSLLFQHLGLLLFPLQTALHVKSFLLLASSISEETDLCSRISTGIIPAS